MATRSKKLAAGGFPGPAGAVVTVYTVPANTTTIVKSAILSNGTTGDYAYVYAYTAGSENITLSVVASFSGGNDISNPELWVVLEPGDFIAVSGQGVWRYWISGAELV